MGAYEDYLRQYPEYASVPQEYVEKAKKAYPALASNPYFIYPTAKAMWMQAQRSASSSSAPSSGGWHTLETWGDTSSPPSPPSPGDSRPPPSGGGGGGSPGGGGGITVVGVLPEAYTLGLKEQEVKRLEEQVEEAEKRYGRGEIPYEVYRERYYEPYARAYEEYRRYYHEAYLPARQQEIERVAKKATSALLEAYPSLREKGMEETIEANIRYLLSEGKDVEKYIEEMARFGARLEAHREAERIFRSGTKTLGQEVYERAGGGELGSFVAGIGSVVTGPVDFLRAKLLGTKFRPSEVKVEVGGEEEVIKFEERPDPYWRLAGELTGGLALTAGLSYVAGMGIGAVGAGTKSALAKIGLSLPKPPVPVPQLTKTAFTAAGIVGAHTPAVLGTAAHAEQVAKSGGSFLEAAGGALVMAASYTVGGVALGRGVQVGAGLVRTKGLPEIPTERLVEPQVLSGRERFPLYSQETMRGTPTSRQPKMFSEFAVTSKRFSAEDHLGRVPWVGGKGGATPLVRMYHATSKEFASLTRALPGTSETPGMYFAPSASPHFLRVGGGAYGGFGFPSLTPTLYAVDTSLSMLPRSVVRQGPALASRWIGEGAKRGTAYLTPYSVWGKTEKEAIVPPGTVLRTKATVGYVKWRGVRVPVKTASVHPEEVLRPYTPKAPAPSGASSRGVLSYPISTPLSPLFAASSLRPPTSAVSISSSVSSPVRPSLSPLRSLGAPSSVIRIARSAESAGSKVPSPSVSVSVPSPSVSVRISIPRPARVSGWRPLGLGIPFHATGKGLRSPLPRYTLYHYRRMVGHPRELAGLIPLAGRRRRK